MEDLVSRQSFWQRANAIVKAIKPLYEVLRAMDSERDPQMGVLYHMMEKAKAQIMEADVAHAQEYIDIIERRWGAQMGRKLHLAAYYLNPRFQHENGIGMDDELFHALRNVIYKMEPDPEVVASCIEEITTTSFFPQTKLFREGSHSFGQRLAVVSKTTMNPGTIQICKTPLHLNYLQL
ncbi:uncharacterized protein LOC120112497 [Phoenix dactylifera]|uniref:Uncharacterized protein LOC120112497 n=1 Tax=Phoenix dactylifera TaxID=42345 RepID=A0A8B9AMJ2_PHODC|nr:uncharacterized protein LOC120112497 [Phoenix dactylifera]